jgi:hypothetical protein
MKITTTRAGGCGVWGVGSGQTPCQAAIMCSVCCAVLAPQWRVGAFLPSACVMGPGCWACMWRDSPLFGCTHGLKSPRACDAVFTRHPSLRMFSGWVVIGWLTPRQGRHSFSFLLLWCPGQTGQPPPLSLHLLPSSWLRCLRVTSSGEMFLTPRTLPASAAGAPVSVCASVKARV